MEWYKTFWIVFSSTSLSVLLCPVQMGTCYELQDLLNLKGFLFNQSQYDPSVRPIVNQSDVLKVYIGISFSAMTNFTVTSGTITMLSVLSMYWRDEQLTWNSSQFGGVDRISLASDLIWTPPLSQMTDVGYKFPISPTWIYSNGSVIMIQGGDTTGHCHIDMRYFPYDVHDCTIDFVSVVHPSEELQLTATHDEINLGIYAENGQWDILDTRSEVTQLIDLETGIMADYYVNKLKVRRKPDFLMLHVAVPMALILTLNTFVYLVPLESGERISISVTLLLTMVFFTTDLSDTIPESSDNISLLSMLMVAVNSSSTLSVAASVILCRIITSSTKTIPRPLERITRLFTRSPKVAPQTNHSMVDTVSIINDLEETNVDRPSGKGHVTENVEEREITWTDVAKCVDFILFTLTFIFVIIVCFGFTGAMVHIHLKSFDY